MRQGMIRQLLTPTEWGIIVVIVVILGSVVGMASCGDDDSFEQYEVNDGVCSISADTAKAAKELYEICAAANRGQG